MSIIDFKHISFDTLQFEKGNDLTKNNFYHETTQSDIFSISDGTKYECVFDTHLSIHKVLDK